MKRSILVVPELDGHDELPALVHRLGFYLAHVDPASVVLVGGSEARTTVEAVLADPAPVPGFDPVTAGLLRGLADRFHIVDPGRARERLVDAADVVLVWDNALGKGWQRALSGRTPNLSVVDVDVARTRLEGWRLAGVVERLNPSGAADADRNRACLAALVADLGRADAAYLVATGPSATAAMEHDLSDGIRIVCNTVVLDTELMRHVRPHLVTFADPIFHFGPSAYAGRFRTALAAAAAEHDFRIVVTERHYRLLVRLLPELEPRVVGIPHGDGDAPTNLDLSVSPIVRTRPNILTLLMLPLASTLAEEIRLIGFDGREPGESYFWKHGASVQLHDELDGIRRVHPAFFDVDYADYYDQHVQTVESYVRAAEALGKRVISLTPSHLPALRRRAAVDHLPARRPSSLPPARRDVLVSVDPDWVNEWGHHRSLNGLLHRLASEQGWSFVALASRGLCPDADWQRPTFTHPTRAGAAAAAYAGTFQRELTAALDELAGRAGRVTTVFYTAALWHLPSLLTVARDVDGDVRFVVNLMRAHTEITSAVAGPDPTGSWPAVLLAEAVDLAESLAVTVTVDTDELNDDIETLVGKRLPLWPMVSLADHSAAGGTKPRASAPVRVYAPVKAQVTRGYGEFAALATAVSRAPDSAGFEFVTRYEHQPNLAPPAIRRAVRRMESAGVTILRGSLDDTAYAAELARADIVVLPYHTVAFRTHTSGVLVDALRAGRPVVTTAGTWLGSVVERYGIGVTCADRDAADLERAVRHVAADVDTWHRRVADARARFEHDFSPELLWGFLDARRVDVRTADLDRDDRVRRLHALSTAALRRDLDQERALRAAQARHSTREHEHAHDRAADAMHIERLERSVARRDRRIKALRGKTTRS